MTTEATGIKEITTEILINSCKKLENLLEMDTVLENQNFLKHIYKK